ncbi:cation:proton antiporter [Halanaerobacter jeridensis]|uniref:Kef-type K+ transport system membrane component KefB n=1 Tax=Halanaerobacter jeridensis TaxID=706427 RepID=A0A938XWA4_9FIRM|nr:cation:proton antiporter [Halanaerobacter jeridensis]MBM7558004.1 Kef-type K+ transport system membrane component KefB [Halanaerobacter jeridensis]
MEFLEEVMALEEVMHIKIIEELMMFHEVGNQVISLVAIFFLLALFVVLLAKNFKVPIVVGYVFLGILLSVDLVKLIPFLTKTQVKWYSFIIESLDYVPQVALGFIAFTIGSELSIELFKKLGKKIGFIVIFEAFGAFSLVTLATLAIGKELYFALLLGAIASATAPAATVMVLQEYNAKGTLTSMVLAVVGIDDAISLIIFSLVEPIALLLYSGSGEISFVNTLGIPIIEIIGSIVIGLAVGYLSQSFIVSKEDHTIKILTIFTTIIGSSAIAINFELSPLITNMAVGFAYRNFATRNLGIEEYMETLTTPLYAIFFILAGTEIRFGDVFTSSFLIVVFVYTLARMTGKIGGAYLGGVVGKAQDKVKKYLGLCLFPQSGVAIALAYTVQKDFASNPEVGLLVFNTLLFTAALTEVFGPLATKYAITKAGEINPKQ